jgi:AcrR family transcriptional regulator
MRKRPLQERSRQRLERILDAAASVFADWGYEAATMEAIAARAETSIGSVYQFFPNKVAVFDAVAARYLERSRALFDAMWETGAMEGRPWHELLDGFIDAFFAFHASDVGFRAVWHSLRLSPEFVAAGEKLNREFSKRAEGVLARDAPHLPPDKRKLVARMLVEVTSSMLVVSSRSDPKLAGRIQEETKVLLHRYVDGYEPRAAAGPAKAKAKRRRAPA